MNSNKNKLGMGEIITKKFYETYKEIGKYANRKQWTETGHEEAQTMDLLDKDFRSIKNKIKVREQWSDW